VTKTAVILFNLGGPDRLDAVEPFLFNLFNDPAIITLPNPFRYCLARWIAWRRAPIAKHIYEKIGGGSPLLAMTQAQATALDARLNHGEADTQFKSFIAMRYWHPMSNETAASVKEFGPDRIILLPLYPQYSTTTTGSSLSDWHRAANDIGLNAPTQAICCYPVNEAWIAAQSALVTEQLIARQSASPVRVLFSAHGLPKKFVENGDPYQHQIEMTGAALAASIPGEIDWSLCYQSRVGRLQWIGPSTDDEIARAAHDGKGIVIVPIAFVSEHSETLVELDIEYRDMAANMGVTDYTRVDTVGTHDQFIDGLAGLVNGGLCRPAQEGNIAPGSGVRLCPRESRHCALEVKR
jgi:protoporphyrin/coproporphyrin ferrochelatase